MGSIVFTIVLLPVVVDFASLVVVELTVLLEDGDMVLGA